MQRTGSQAANTQPRLHRYNSRLSIDRGGNAFSSPRSSYRDVTPDRKRALDAEVASDDADRSVQPVARPLTSTLRVLHRFQPAVHGYRTAGCGGRPQKTGKRESDRGGTKSGAGRNRHATGRSKRAWLAFNRPTYTPVEKSPIVH